MLDEKIKSVGYTTRWILYHFKAIQERFINSKAGFKENDKYIIQKQIDKVEVAIENFISIVKERAIADGIKRSLERKDLVCLMTLIEQLMDLPDEDLEDITDLIDDFLKKKHEHSTGQEAV